MEARLLYIREIEMNSDLSRILNEVERLDRRFLILVEITPIKVDSMPMINGLKEIRLNKVKEKIENWFKENLSDDICFELTVFEGKPSKVNPPVTLKGIDKLFLFVDASNDIRIVPFLKAQIAPEKIVFFPIGQVNNKKLPQLNK
jgi:hypothetical protein